MTLLSVQIGFQANGAFVWPGDGETYRRKIVTATAGALSKSISCCERPVQYLSVAAYLDRINTDSHLAAMEQLYLRCINVVAARLLDFDSTSPNSFHVAILPTAPRRCVPVSQASPNARSLYVQDLPCSVSDEGLLYNGSRSAKEVDDCNLIVVVLVYL